MTVRFTHGHCHKQSGYEFSLCRRWLLAAFPSLNQGRILDLSPGVVGHARKTLIDRVHKQKEGPHKTSIGRSVILVAGVEELLEI